MGGTTSIDRLELVLEASDDYFESVVAILEAEITDATRAGQMRSSVWRIRRLRGRQQAWALAEIGDRRFPATFSGGGPRVVAALLVLYRQARPTGDLSDRIWSAVRDAEISSGEIVEGCTLASRLTGWKRMHAIVVMSTPHWLRRGWKHVEQPVRRRALGR
jgi:hypothetical protein